MPAMASNVIEAQSHDEGKCRGGRSVTGVHGSAAVYRTKVLLGALKNEWAQKCNRGMASQFKNARCIIGNGNVSEK